ncbi:MAG TPA: hypothetical protein VE710_08250 [Candidatus Bathyarchaeia archaeon]|nr:hypothetical protein [Candidatus Bathyarchaeia archaeon]
MYKHLSCNKGAIASYFLTLPATATFIAAFSLNWIWVPIFAAFVAGLKGLFLELGIYHHHWWRLEIFF